MGISGGTAAIAAVSKVTGRKRETRIEALRAASRVVAGGLSGRPSGQAMPEAEATLHIAEQFAKWLEDG